MVKGAEAVHQGPESFAKVMEAKKAPMAKAEVKNSPKPKDREDRAPHEDSTDGGKAEVGSRTSKNLTVKQADRKDKAPTDDQAEAGPVGKRNKSQKQSGPQDEHAAMQEFMDSMESEFGIPPTRVVEAMAELDTQDLVRLPEDTASQVIKNLDLPPGDQEKAMALYMSLLQKLAPQPPMAKQEPLYAPPVVLNVVQGSTPGQASALTADQAQMLKLMKAAKAGDPEALAVIANRLNQTIDSDLHTLQQVLQKLEQSSQAAVQSGDAPADLAASLAALDVSMKNLDAQNPNQALKSTDAQMQSPEMRAAMASAASGAAMVSPQVAAAGYQDMAAANVATPAADSGMGAALQTKSFFAPIVGSGSSAVSSGSAASASAVVTGNSANDVAGGLLVAGGGRSSDSKQGSADADSDSGNSSNGQGDSKAQKLGNEFAIDNRQLTKAEAGLKPMNTAQGPQAAQNLEKVNDQAQIMIRQGGGEAVVKLNPEGLGEVHLKVTVADGKVNVQMSAATREARDLLESSMKDLKAALGAHNLKIDHMKVDVGNQASADAGGQSHARGFDMDQGRDQARQFLNQFADDGAANRNPFHRPERAKVYGGATGAAPARDVTTAATGSARRFVGEGRGSGLNLVA